MPPFEPFLIVFVVGILLNTFAKSVLLRYPLASVAIFFVSALTAQLLGSPHVFFYLSVLLSLSIGMQFSNHGLRGTAGRVIVPVVAFIWGLSWFQFPTAYVDISKWLALLIFILFLILSGTKTLNLADEPSKS